MKSTPTDATLSAADRGEFKRLDKVVRKGMAAFMETGLALAAIHERKLWKAGSQTSWEAYCREAIGMSKAHVHRLVDGSRIAHELVESSPVGDDSRTTLPVCESQVRPLAKIKDRATRCMLWASAVNSEDGQPTSKTVSAVVEKYIIAQENLPSPSADSHTDSGTNSHFLVEVETTIVDENPTGEEQDVTLETPPKLPSKIWFKKSLLIVSMIRGEVLGQCRKDEILKLTEELKADIESTRDYL